MSGKNESHLWQKLAVAMFELKNFWEATALKQIQPTPAKLLEIHNL